MDLLDELESHLVCGDGAMGTMLLEEGVPFERCLEELCLSEPERVRKIHDAYVAAGARVIETNTFGANAVRLERFGFGERTHEINAAAAGSRKRLRVEKMFAWRAASAHSESRQMKRRHEE